MVWLPYGEKSLSLVIYLAVSTENRRATNTQTDGRMDRQTSCHSIVCAMHTRRAVKTTIAHDPDDPGPAHVSAVYVQARLPIIAGGAALMCFRIKTPERHPGFGRSSCTN